MFEQTFVEGTGKTKTPFDGDGVFHLPVPPDRCRHSHSVDLHGHACPATQLTSFLVAPPPPPPPPPPPAAAPVKAVRVIPRQFDAGRLMAPKVIPKEIAMIKEDELPPPLGRRRASWVALREASGRYAWRRDRRHYRISSAGAPPPPPPK